MKNQITTQTLTKNCDEFIREALLSVKDYVKKMVVYDTGSTDKTIPIIEKLIKEGLNIEFVKRGPFKGSGKAGIPELTAIRNEIIDNCRTEWMMIVDEDEIYTKEIFEELYEVLTDKTIMAVVIPFYSFIDRHTILKPGAFSPNGRLLRAKYVELRRDWPRERICVRGEEKFLYPPADPRRVATLKNKYYHYNLAKKVYWRPRKKRDDIIKFKGKQPFEGKQPFDFPNWK